MYQKIFDEAPSTIEVSGRVGRRADHSNGVYDIQDTLHDGRPMWKRRDALMSFIGMQQLPDGRSLAPSKDSPILKSHFVTESLEM